MEAIMKDESGNVGLPTAGGTGVPALPTRNCRTRICGIN